MLYYCFSLERQKKLEEEEKIRKTREDLLKSLKKEEEEVIDDSIMNFNKETKMWSSAATEAKSFLKDLMGVDDVKIDSMFSQDCVPSQTYPIFYYKRLQLLKKSFKSQKSKVISNVVP